ncbi:MAG: linear amide C-N hydrolase [Deltaproteobacteria bacterium]|nr:linear amide C-N hydrolase [Deltaproteobacteria bacterium]
MAISLVVGNRAVAHFLQGLDMKLGVQDPIAVFIMCPMGTNLAVRNLNPRLCLLKGYLTRKLCVLVSLIAAGGGFACTSFNIFTEGQNVVGKGLDWHQGHGMLAVNKRNVSKTALTVSPTDIPASWVSRYGSVTFNQYGREFPYGGMNEKGLVVEILLLPKTNFPQSDNRPALNELQWIQYQLDNYATVSELFDHVEDLRISRVYAPVHYMVCDRSGVCGSVEFLDGRLVGRWGGTMPIKTLTNDTYEESLRFLRQFIGFGGQLPIPAGYGSLERFAQAADSVRRYSQSINPVSYSLKLLRNLSNSQWRIVYNLISQNIHFATFGDPNEKIVSMAFDFACSRPTLVLDVNREGKGDVTQFFMPYTRSANEKIVTLAFKRMEHVLPEGFKERVIDYPQSTHCNQMH